LAFGVSSFRRISARRDGGADKLVQQVFVHQGLMGAPALHRKVQPTAKNRQLAMMKM
jgi:hypothetical protein